MNKENPVLFSLKLKSHEVIEDLYISGYGSYKSCCKVVFQKSKIKKIQTGFHPFSFQKFYDQYRKFKSLIHNNSQGKNFLIVDN